MIQSQQYENFLKAVVDELEGDWVIVGGSLLALIKTSCRATSDIDLCPLGEMNNDLRLSLMKIAQASNLPIEALNPAADLFLKQIPGWKNSIVLFQKGQKGSLYRPSLELYIRLKLGRASETDIQDILTYLLWHQRQALPYDENVCRSLIQAKIQKAQHQISEDPLKQLLHSFK